MCIAKDAYDKFQPRIISWGKYRPEFQNVTPCHREGHAMILSTTECWRNAWHSQLLNIIILKFNPPVLLNLLGNIFPHCPAVRAIQRINYSNIDLPGRSTLELLLRMSVFWLNMGNPLGSGFIYQHIYLHLSQYRYKISTTTAKQV